MGTNYYLKQPISCKAEDQIVAWMQKMVDESNTVLALKAQLIALIDGIKEGRARKEPCPCVDQRNREGLHIGKSSAGWCFGLHIYDYNDYRLNDLFGALEDFDPRSGPPVSVLKRSIVDLDRWIPLFEKYGCVDEYNKDVSAEDMLAVIRDRSWLGNENAPTRRIPITYAEAIDAGGGDIDQASGLIRRRIDPDHCIGYGPGPWDYCKGDFS